MYYLPNLDRKLNYQLYLLIYGDRQLHWYEEIISKLQQFMNIIHKEIKDCKCPFLLVILASILTFILCGIIIKILSHLYRTSDDYQNLQLNQLRLSEIIERDEEFISNSDISERSDPVIKQEINEILENYQAIESCQEVPCIKECLFEGYKKLYVLTINVDDLPAHIVEKLYALSDTNNHKLKAYTEIQSLITEIIDKVLTQASENCEKSHNNCTKCNPTAIETMINNSLSLEGKCEDQIKLFDNEYRTNKIHSGSKIPLLLKSRQQRQFIKNINDPQ